MEKEIAHAICPDFFTVGNPEYSVNLLTSYSPSLITNYKEAWDAVPMSFFLVVFLIFLMNNISTLVLVMKNNAYGRVTQVAKKWKKPQVRDLNLV